MIRPRTAGAQPKTAKTLVETGLCGQLRERAWDANGHPQAEKLVLNVLAIRRHSLNTFRRSLRSALGKESTETAAAAIIGCRVRSTEEGEMSDA